MKMTETIRVRISKEMKEHLEALTQKRGPGSKISDLVREAVYQVYGERPQTNGNRHSKAA